MTNSSELRCPSCKLRVKDAQVTNCPACGTRLEPDVDKPPAEGEWAFNVSFSIFQCDQCQETFSLDGSGKCPACGTKVQKDDPNALSRSQTIGPSVAYVKELASKWGIEQTNFERRGTRPELKAHWDTLRFLASEMPLAALDSAKGIFSRTDWDGPEAPASIEALVAIAEEVFFAVAALRKTPPPLSLLASHRQVARSLAHFGEALTVYMQALVAPTIAEAQALVPQGQEALDMAGEHAKKFGASVDLLETQLSLSPGWWTTGEEFDFGRAAWEGVGAAESTIAEGAAQVREALSDLPGIDKLDESQLLLLLPTTALAGYDPIRLVEKARQARLLLDRAGDVDSWVADVPLMVQQVWDGHRKLTDQIIRVGFLLQHDAPRRILLQELTDMYSKLLEGPFRHFGTILCVASRFPANPGAFYDESAVVGSSYASALNYFSQVAPDLGEGAETLLRNAEAHYSFEILDDGIEFRDVHRQGGGQVRRRQDLLNDDDFLEELLATVETLASFELALLPFLWTDPSQSVAHELAQLAQLPAEKGAGVRLLSGLKGFVEMSIVEGDDSLRLRSTYLGEEASPFVEFLPALAAIWETWDVSQVELEVESTRETLSFTYMRGQFQDMASPNAHIKQHKVASLIYLLRRETETLSSAQLDDLGVRYLLLPFLMFALEGTQNLSLSPTKRDLDEVADYLEWFRPFLNAATLTGDVHSFAKTIGDSARGMLAALKEWRVGVTKKDAHWSAKSRSRFFVQVQRLAGMLDKARSFLVEE